MLLGIKIKHLTKSWKYNPVFAVAKFTKSVKLLQEYTGFHNRLLAVFLASVQALVLLKPLEVLKLLDQTISFWRYDQTLQYMFWRNLLNLRFKQT